MSNNTHIKYDLAKTGVLIKSVYKANCLYPNEKTTVNIVGPKGIGKTQAISSYAKDLGIHYEKITLPNYDDTTALMGYPRKTYKMKKTLINKHDKEVELIRDVESEFLEKYKDLGFKQLSAEPELTYTRPDWVNNIIHAKEGSILHIDEYNRAQSFIKQAIMELINSGEYASYKLPSNCSIVLTSNPNDGNYNIVSADDEAHSDRFFTINVEFMREPWCSWAEKVEIREEAINFIYQVVEATGNTKSPSIRTWTKFFRNIQHVTDLKKPDNIDLIADMGSISVGDYASMYINFIKNNLDIIPSMKEIFNESVHKKTILDIISTSMKDKDTGRERQDIKALLGLRLKNYIRAQNSLSKSFVDRLLDILTGEVLHADSINSILEDFTNPNHPHRKSLERIYSNNDIIKIITE